MKLRKQLVRSLPGVRAREPEVETMKVDVLEDGAGTVERVVLRHYADEAARNRWRLDDFDPSNSLSVDNLHLRTSTDLPFHHLAPK